MSPSKLAIQSEVTLANKDSPNAGTMNIRPVRS